MGYAGDEFWKAYGEYLAESAPRHRAAIDALNVFATTSLTRGTLPRQLGLYGRRVLDLGCGQHCSVAKLFEVDRYLGVDAHPPEEFPWARRSMLRVCNPQPILLQADYRNELGIVIDAVLNPPTDSWLLDPLYPDLVTSLFSVEITDIADINYALYQQLFRELPTVKYLVVSGFYYTDKWTQTVVKEAGGLKSFQTIDLLLPEPEDEDYTEFRVYLPAPSTLFGPNVIEVWKLFIRRDAP